MAALTDRQKLFVVQRLACFHTISEVQELLKEEWAIEVPSNQLARYNPLTLSGDTLSAHLRDLFERTRQQFIDDKESIAIAHKNFRLRELLDLYRRAKEKKNYPLAAELLKQAAQDEGGMFIRDAGTDPDIDRRIAELLEALAEQGQAKTAGPPAGEGQGAM